MRLELTPGKIGMWFVHTQKARKSIVIEPSVTKLFAALGDLIADDFEIFGADANQQIFQLIESAMSCDEEMLVVEVTTGLIEAIMTKSGLRKYLWKRIQQIKISFRFQRQNNLLTLAHIGANQSLNLVQIFLTKEK